MRAEQPKFQNQLYFLCHIICTQINIPCLKDFASVPVRKHPIKEKDIICCPPWLYWSPSTSKPLRVQKGELECDISHYLSTNKFSAKSTTKLIILESVVIEALAVVHNMHWNSVEIWSYRESCQRVMRSKL
jgi:hypothetical protein